MWLLADGPVSLSDGVCAFLGNGPYQNLRTLVSDDSHAMCQQYVPLVPYLAFFRDSYHSMRFSKRSRVRDT